MAYWKGPRSNSLNCGQQFTEGHAQTWIQKDHLNSWKCGISLNHDVGTLSIYSRSQDWLSRLSQLFYNFLGEVGKHCFLIEVVTTKIQPFPHFIKAPQHNIALTIARENGQVWSESNATTLLHPRSRREFTSIQGEEDVSPGGLTIFGITWVIPLRYMRCP